MIVRTFFLIAMVTLACPQASHVGSVKAPWAVAAAPVPIEFQPFEAAAGPAPIQRPGFVAVEGANLSARMDAAVRLGRAAQALYWTAYAFDVRPGVSVDMDWDGKRTSMDGVNISFDATRETRNLGVFLLREPNDTAVTRVEVYNLDRAREYSGYRVYWLGRAGNEESLNLLRGLVEGRNDKIAAKVSEHATMAIALHDDARVAGILKNFVRQSSVEKVRTSAVFWLGQVGGETQFLADLARNESEGREVRKQAAFAIGISKDSDAISTLQNLYHSVTNRDVKEQIIFAASINQDKDAGVNFLIDVAGKENDQESRKKAIFWLGQKAGERSLNALKDTLDSSDGDTEVQKQAVFAISQRPKDESVPLLIKIAKTHANPAVRKQAIFWLGQTGDERAVDFFKEILLK
ncbi:MAG TPA: HEAT repeat domain-containing protein [Blastocatellia bacterium]|jgi:HEAT repeat protein|nr:HEAT repeat domain-containing protein [Blastocatellia bacterium]